MEDGWCKLHVLPIVRLPGDLDKAEKLYHQLLKLNGEILLARFSLDEDGDVILSVELPLHDLDASEIIIAGCDNYTGGRRYWHSSPNQRADMQGVNPADVWRMVRSHLQHPERVKVCSGPLTEVFTCA